MLRVRIDEGSDPQPNLLWDSVWSPTDGRADWAMADADETQNRGGLRAKAALHTAIILLLFTDRRISADHPLRYLVEDGDPRGWWGDGVDVRDDVSEAELGSLLWVFERAHLNEDIRKWVEVVALEALAPLIAQGAAVRIEAQAEAQFAINRVDLAVQVYGRDGAQTFNVRFDDIWRQTASAPKPLPFPSYPDLTPPTTTAGLDFSLDDNSGYLALLEDI
jgi:phage gp46-like protein